MSNTVKSYIIGILGIGVSVVGWGIDQDMQRLNELDFAALPLILIVLGGVINLINKAPADAKRDDERGY